LKTKINIFQKKQKRKKKKKTKVKKKGREKLKKYLYIDHLNKNDKDSLSSQLE